MPSGFEGMSGNPLLGLTGYREKCLKVIETERSPIAPRCDLSLHGKGRAKASFVGRKEIGYQKSNAALLSPNSA